MSERWAAEVEARARAHWTDERTARLLDGKDLPITPREAAPLLRALGLLDGDAKMPPDRVRKFRQINHMVLLLRAELARLGPTVRVLDAGCGRSYLSLLLAWCGRHRWGQRVEILGVDRNAALIDECARRAELAGLSELTRFVAGSIDALEPSYAPDALVALHACDRASCDAIALGVERDARLIAVAPCCQAELAARWGDASALSVVQRSPHLRREMAAHLTDAMRLALLRASGYRAEAIEFVPVEHTKKNTLIKAERSGARDDDAVADYRALEAVAGGAGIALAERLLGRR